MKGITTIIFDLGGVLMDLDKNACIRAFQAIGFKDIDEYLDIYLPKEGVFKQLEQGQIGTDEFHEGVRKLIGRSVTDESIDDAYREMLAGIPGYKLEMLRQLKEHYQILLLSNTNPIMMDYIRKTYFMDEGVSWKNYFDELFLSYELKMTKPDPAIFKEVIRRSGIHPETTFYLDDSPRNIEAGKSFGLKTYTVQPHEDFRFLFNK